jgi:hypothetical protein
VAECASPAIPRSFVFDTARRNAAVSTAVAATLDRAVREDRAGVRVVDDVSLTFRGIAVPHQPLQVVDESTIEDGVVGAEL